MTEMEVSTAATNGVERVERESAEELARLEHELELVTKRCLYLACGGVPNAESLFALLIEQPVLMAANPFVSTAWNVGGRPAARSTV